MISAIETVNCTTTKTLRGSEANRPALNVPFNTLTGWNDDRNSAGQLPERKLVTTMNTALRPQKVIFVHGKDIFLPARLLNHGNKNPTNARATNHDSNTTINDSVRN